MRSKVAEQVRAEQRKRALELTAAERSAVASRMGNESLALYMAAHRVDRVEALRVVRQSRRAGRRPSASMDSLDEL